MEKILFITLLACCTFTSCTTKSEREEKDIDSYEKSKLSLEEIEKRSPVKFLSVTGSDKKNLLGQTVVKGKIRNNAKAVTYKDVDITLSFYSKTGTLLMEDQEIIYDTYEPGATKPFKSKYFAPKGTDSIAMKVTKASF